MYTASFFELTAPRLPPAPLTGGAQGELVGEARTPMDFAPAPARDAPLVLAALEQIQAQRAAIEWLVEADLLCACSV